MDSKLKRISEILPEVWKDLKELNDRFDERERENGRPILPASDAGTTRDGNQTTGDNK